MRIPMALALLWERVNWLNFLHCFVGLVLMPGGMFFAARHTDIEFMQSVYVIAMYLPGFETLVDTLELVIATDAFWRRGLIYVVIYSCFTLPSCIYFFCFRRHKIAFALLACSIIVPVSCYLNAMLQSSRY